VALRVFGVAGSVLSASCTHPALKEQVTMPSPLFSEAEAIERALAFTRFDQLDAITTSAEQITGAENPVPFVGRALVGQDAWRVTVGNVQLKLPSAVPGYKDRYVRTFSILLSAPTGQLVAIRSRPVGNALPLRPEPSAESAESQLQAEEETYQALPERLPTVRLLDALDRVLADGIGSPLVAQEINAVYVIHSRLGTPPLAVWAITLRGIPPLPARGPGAESVPVWQRNHIRNVVDAETGKVLFAKNSPQPE
jgi:hypothetical protein